LTENDCTNGDQSQLNTTSNMAVRQIPHCTERTSISGYCYLCQVNRVNVPLWGRYWFSSMCVCLCLLTERQTKLYITVYGAIIFVLKKIGGLKYPKIPAYATAIWNLTRDMT